jgi:hypothetical protein
MPCFWVNPAGAEPLHTFPKKMILCSTEVIENYRLVDGEVRFIPYDGRASGDVAWVELSGKAQCEKGEQTDFCKNRAVFNGLSQLFDHDPFRKPQIVKTSTSVEKNAVSGDRIELNHFLLIHPGLELLKEEMAGREYQVVFKVGVSEVQGSEGPGSAGAAAGYTSRVRGWFDQTADGAKRWGAGQARRFQRSVSSQARRFRDFIWQQDRGYDSANETVR